MKIKICGIKRKEDLLNAIELGADYIGLIFYPPSKRYIAPEEALLLLKDVDLKQTQIVALFVNPNKEEVENVLNKISNIILQFHSRKTPVILQFHGNETPEFCQQFNNKYWKAVPMNDLKSASEVIDFMNKYEADAFLLDSFGQNQTGGSGKTFNWEAVPKSTFQKCLNEQSSDKSASQRIFIAGGLNETNVGEVIENYYPFGVDVSSGVEDAPAEKSFVKMLNFIQICRSHQAEQKDF